MKIRGFELEITPVSDSFVRRAVQLQNKTLEMLSQIGVKPEDVEFSDEKIPIKAAAAHISWWLNGSFCHYSHSQQKRYIDNLQAVAKIIEFEVRKVLDGQKTAEQLAHEYNEDSDFKEQRQKAREMLQVDAECKDMELINSQYRKLSKQTHPDMPGGAHEKFKQVNWAHKTLKRELE